MHHWNCVRVYIFLYLKTDTEINFSWKYLILIHFSLLLVTFSKIGIYFHDFVLVGLIALLCLTLDIKMSYIDDFLCSYFDL